MALFFNLLSLKPPIGQEVVQQHVLGPLKQQQATVAILLAIKPNSALQATYQLLLDTEQAITACFMTTEALTLNLS